MKERKGTILCRMFEQGVFGVKRFQLNVSQAERGVWGSGRG